MKELIVPKCASGLITHDVYIDKDGYCTSWYSNCDNCKYFCSKGNAIVRFTCVYGYLNSRGLR